MLYVTGNYRVLTTNKVRRKMDKVEKLISTVYFNEGNDESGYEIYFDGDKYWKDSYDVGGSFGGREEVINE